MHPSEKNSELDVISLHMKHGNNQKVEKKS